MHSIDQVLNKQKILEKQYWQTKGKKKGMSITAPRKSSKWERHHKRWNYNLGIINSEILNLNGRILNGGTINGGNLNDGILNDGILNDGMINDATVDGEI